MQIMTIFNLIKEKKKKVDDDRNKKEVRSYY